MRETTGIHHVAGRADASGKAMRGEGSVRVESRPSCASQNENGQKSPLPSAVYAKHSAAPCSHGSGASSSTATDSFVRSTKARILKRTLERLVLLPIFFVR